MMIFKLTLHLVLDPESLVLSVYCDLCVSPRVYRVGPLRGLQCMEARPFLNWNAEAIKKVQLIRSHINQHQPSLHGHGRFLFFLIFLNVEIKLSQS